MVSKKQILNLKGIILAILGYQKRLVVMSSILTVLLVAFLLIGMTLNFVFRKRRKNIRIIVKMLNAMNIGYVYAYHLKKIVPMFKIGSDG